MSEKKVYGVCSSTFQQFKSILENRKSSLIIKAMNSESITVSNGCVVETYQKDNRTLVHRLEVNEPCIVKINMMTSKVTITIFAKSDEKKYNFLYAWPVKYLCKGNLSVRKSEILAFEYIFCHSDFTSRGDLEEEHQLSHITIHIGPDCSSHVDGLRAELDPSHFATQKSILVLKCFANEWIEVNRQINKLFQHLPMASDTLREEDSANSSPDSTP